MSRILAGFDSVKASRANSDRSTAHGPYEKRPEHLKVAYWLDVLNDLRTEADVHPFYGQ